MRCSAQRCTADPGSLQSQSGSTEFATIPGLQCITPLRYVLHRARETMVRQLTRRRFFVYVLANRPKGVIYVGVTNDLARRIFAHRTRAAAGFTSKYGVMRLVYYEEYASILEARAREHALKRWRRAWKFELVEKANPNWRELYDELILL